MNWAVQHELPEGQKTPHHAVSYENPSKHDDKVCAVCRNFIPAYKLRCRTVAMPIARGAWCVRFSRTSSTENGETE